MNDGNASAKQPVLSLESPGDETAIGEKVEDISVCGKGVMERMLSRKNMFSALKRVRKNGGSPGVDGVTVEELSEQLRRQWPRIKEEIQAGKYKPQPILRVEIPKEGGGKRLLGIPTVIDRLIQQALMQVLQSDWDKTFSNYSYGFRPGRSAHQAVAQAQTYINSDYKWVVDIDLEKFFDTVNHDVMMVRVKRWVSDRAILKLIHRFLAASVSVEGNLEKRRAGCPQGGPLSPLLANLLLDDLDKELERRGHHFVRYADDCNIYMRSQRAGERLMVSITKFLSKKLKLKVNESKSAVDRPWNRKFLGFTVTSREKEKRRKVSEPAIKKLKRNVRAITRRTRGRNIQTIINELSKYLLGWRAYFGFAQVKSPIIDLDKWIRRRLRCYLLKQWGRRGYRELRRRGVTVKLSWYTFKSAHGPWRLSKSPALSYALPGRYFTSLGLVSLAN